MKFYYSNNDVNVRLVRDVRKKDIEGECPLKWCVYKKNRRYYSTGKSLTLKDWILFEESEEPDFNFKTKALHLKECKDDIQKYFDDTMKPAIKALSSNFTFEALNKRLGKSDVLTVNDAFNAKIDDLMDKNKVANASIYREAYSALQRFKHYKKTKGKAKDEFLQKCIEFAHVSRGKNKIMVNEEIIFPELTPQFLGDCARFWRNTGASTSTISIRMRTIRAIVKNINKPFLTGDQYPFGRGKYQIPSSTRREEFCPIGDIWLLEEYETDNPDKEMAKAVFVFMFYGSGLNFKDFCLLKYSDITYDNELKFYREKTDTESGGDPRPIYVPLIHPMIEIINRYGNKDRDGYIFPFLNGVDENDEPEIKKLTNRYLDPINTNLKVIAEELGLNTNISTNWARHSYMTHLLTEEMLNEIVVKKMVGHSTKKDVTAGYTHLTPKKRREINSKLLNPDKRYEEVRQN